MNDQPIPEFEIRTNWRDFCFLKEEWTGNPAARGSTFVMSKWHLEEMCSEIEELRLFKSRAEQAEQKLAKAMKAQEWMRKNIRVDNDSARFTYLPAKAIKEAAEILNEKESV